MYKLYKLGQGIFKTLIQEVFRRLWERIIGDTSISVVKVFAKTLANEPGELDGETRFHWKIAVDFTLFLAHVYIYLVRLTESY